MPAPATPSVGVMSDRPQIVSRQQKTSVDCQSVAVARKRIAREGPPLPVTAHSSDLLKLECPLQPITREIDRGRCRRSSEMIVNTTHHRPTSRCLAPTVLCVASLLSGACASEEQHSKDARRAESYGTGIVSMETVQRSMALHNQTAPAPAAPQPAPVEVNTPKVEVAPPARPRTRPQPPTHAAAPAVASLPPAAPVAAASMPAAPTAPAVTSAAVPVAEAPAPAPTPALNPALYVEVEASPIYTKDDPDVTPARLLTAQNGAGLDASITDVNSMELVISKLGRVEQARLSAPAKRMTDMVLLSSAKTWKFSPAMRNGQPVRYRTVYSWETTR